jgi:putative ABC transport system substrate-binding protein
LQVKEAELAGRRSGVQLRFYEASSPAEFDTAFAAIRREDIRALHILADPLFTLHWKALAQLVTKDALLAISGSREFAENGGLMAYGPSYLHASKRAATYVDKILKGAKPGDLPVEQATNFDLVINLKTAKALGLTVPPALLARADEVIE